MSHPDLNQSQRVIEQLREALDTRMLRLLAVLRDTDAES